MPIWLSLIIAVNYQNASPVTVHWRKESLQSSFSERFTNQWPGIFICRSEHALVILCFTIVLKWLEIDVWLRINCPANTCAISTLDYSIFTDIPANIWEHFWQPKRGLSHKLISLQGNRGKYLLLSSSKLYPLISDIANSCFQCGHTSSLHLDVSWFKNTGKREVYNYLTIAKITHRINAVMNSWNRKDIFYINFIFAF